MDKTYKIEPTKSAFLRHRNWSWRILAWYRTKFIAGNTGKADRFAE